MLFDNLEYINIENQTTDFPKHFHETFCISLIHSGIEQIEFESQSLFSEKGSISITNPYEIHSNPLINKNICLKFDTIYLSNDLMKYLLNGRNISFVNRKINSERANQLFLELKNAMDIKNPKSIEFFLKQFINTLKFNAENPEAYSDEATELFDVQDAWVDKANDLERKIYPEVKWSLPMIYYPEKFGTDLKKEDSNYFYRKYINNQAYRELLKNEIFYYQDDFEVRNYNVVAPRIFILSPIYYAFASIGYTLKGSVIDSGYFRRMLLGSKNDNMVKVPRKPPGTFLDLEDAAWQEVWAWNPITSLQLRSFAKEVNFEVPIDGNFVLNYNYQKSDQLAGFELEHEGDIFFRDRPYGDYNYSGQVNFTIEEGQSRKITFRYISDQQQTPTNYSF